MILTSEIREKEFQKCYSRDYDARNPEGRKAIRARWYAKAKQDPTMRLLWNCRGRLSKAVKRACGGKSGTTEELIGCSLQQLHAHLESLFRPGMSWKNYGSTWHVDHKKPCAAFNMEDPNQQRICFHFSNLQPLFAKENLEKGDKVS